MICRRAAPGFLVRVARVVHRHCEDGAPRYALAVARWHSFRGETYHDIGHGLCTMAGVYGVAGRESMVSKQVSPNRRSPSESRRLRRYGRIVKVRRKGLAERHKGKGWVVNGFEFGDRNGFGLVTFGAELFVGTLNGFAFAEAGNGFIVCQVVGNGFVLKPVGIAPPRGSARVLT